MGRKISVDSATLMNKGLELIEASYLFGFRSDSIDVIVHPQSTIHSLVHYVDGSVLAQMATPDMRIPIAHALAWPERIVAGVAPLDLIDVSRLDFEAPGIDRYPCLGLASQAAAEGGTAPAILNAANEVAVAAFLERRFPFTAIAEVVSRTLDKLPSEPITGDGVAQVLDADRGARAVAEQNLGVSVG
jgi:1-deoxy-D-xylulose-5-phosphate reductoisomerase